MDKFDYRDNIGFVFGASESYGGNQNYPKNHYEEYRHLVQNYYPDFSEEQIKNMLIKLSSEGCTYVAMVNTVFLFFRDEPELFEEIFEMPMFDRYGKLNFYELLIDFYLRMDNHNPLYLLWYREDYINRKEDHSETRGFGANRFQVEWRFERYMKMHGVRVNVKTISNNKVKKHFDKLTSRGPLAVSVRPTTLYDGQGKEIFNSTGGHCMTVTGATDDGMLKVSSWGNPYYIKPGSYDGYEYYQQVIYKPVSHSPFIRWMIKYMQFPRPLWVKFVSWMMSQ